MGVNFPKSTNICSSFFDEYTDEPKLPALALPLTGGQAAPCRRRVWFGYC